MTCLLLDRRLGHHRRQPAQPGYARCAGAAGLSLYGCVRSGAGAAHRVVGSIVETVVAAENPAQLIARLSDSATRIVSLTITEKGIATPTNRRTRRGSSGYCS